MPVNSPNLDTASRRPAGPPGAEADVPTRVDELLRQARQARASDLHLLPTELGLEIRWRVDGVLQPVTTWPSDLIPRVVARLKVLAGLLTYQTELPQEGRLLTTSTPQEMRLSTFPTLLGEKAVIRFFDEHGRFSQVADLGLPPEVNQQLLRELEETCGVIIVAGPAGSGKTTTLYACLRHLAQSTRGTRNLVSLEDPIESRIPGVSQSQVNPIAGFDLAVGLKSMMRQDPEVIMVGEIRDKSTAEVVFQAALTGHLVLTTFHAGSAPEVLSRLLEMNIEPYLLRSGLRGILCQRLIRKLCGCSLPNNPASETLGLPVTKFRVSQGCDQCQQTGFRDRMLIAEWLRMDLPELGPAILSRRESQELEQIALKAGFRNRWMRALELVEAGMTAPVEIRRGLGWGVPSIYPCHDPHLFSQQHGFSGNHGSIESEPVARSVSEGTS